MKLYTQSYYNPYFVDVNGKARCLDKIIAFDEEGTITNPRGWFGSNNNCAVLDIDCDCVMKRKVDMSCKTAFIVRAEDVSYCSEVRWVLYIPKSVLDLDKPVYSKEMGGTCAVKTIKSKKYPTVYFEVRKFLDRDVREICSKIKECAKSLDYISPFDNPDKIDEVIGRLACLNVEYKLKLVEMKDIELGEW